MGAVLPRFTPIFHGLDAPRTPRTPRTPHTPLRSPGAATRCSLRWPSAEARPRSRPMGPMGWTHGICWTVGISGYSSTQQIYIYIYIIINNYIIWYNMYIYIYRYNRFIFLFIYNYSLIFQYRHWAISGWKRISFEPRNGSVFLYWQDDGNTNTCINSYKYLGEWPRGLRTLVSQKPGVWNVGQPTKYDGSMSGSVFLNMGHPYLHLLLLYNIIHHYTTIYNII